MNAKLTPAAIELLELAERDLAKGGPGNPWPYISIRQRTGGAKRRLFDQLYCAGLFDGMNRITALGRAALKQGEPM